jgi:hypothetical protein
MNGPLAPAAPTVPVRPATASPRNPGTLRRTSLLTGTALLTLALAGALVATLAGAGARQPTGRPVYSEREVADARLQLTDAQVVLGYWDSEIKRCTIEVESWAAATDAETSLKARLAAFPGMLSKAQNARQDAALNVLRAQKRVEFMEQTNDSARVVVTPTPEPRR